MWSQSRSGRGKGVVIDKRRSFGNKGEEQAISYLVKHGYKIIDHGYRCRLGEIDIIAKKGGYLIFCEVKTRKSRGYGYPFEAINEQKKKKIRQIANYYFAYHTDRSLSCRFDVISIESNNNAYQVNHIENAFS